MLYIYMDCLYERKVYYCVRFVTTSIKEAPHSSRVNSFAIGNVKK